MLDKFIGFASRPFYGKKSLYNIARDRSRRIDTYLNVFDPGAKSLVHRDRESLFGAVMLWQVFGDPAKAKFWKPRQHAGGVVKGESSEVLGVADFEFDIHANDIFLIRAGRSYDGQILENPAVYHEVEYPRDAMSPRVLFSATTEFDCPVGYLPHKNFQPQT